MRGVGIRHLWNAMIFQAHLETFLNALALGKHFALTRYGDGERAILEGCEISTLGTNRHWCYRPSIGIGRTIVTDDLGWAFDHDAPDYHVGISCPCCNEADHRYFMSRLSEARINGRTTYANLFSNGNWRHLADRFVDVIASSGRPVVLVSNWDKNYDRAKQKLLRNEVRAAPASEPFFDRPIPNPLGTGFYRGGATLWYSEQRDAILSAYRALASFYRDAIFLVQLGPIANILIHQMFEENRSNTYLDMGHSLDGIVFDEPCRGYMAGGETRICVDMAVSWIL